MHERIVQGAELDSGWRAIASSRGLIASAGRKQRPIVHLWLVPPSVFEECKAGPLKVASKRKASGGKAGEVVATFSRAVDAAHALKPYIVQYAVLIPLPPAPLKPKV